MSQRGVVPRLFPRPSGGLPAYIWVGLGGTTALVVTAYYTNLEQVPFTNRRLWIATSPAWEQRLGDREYQNMVAAHRGNILPATHRAAETVRRVGQRIAQASQTFCQQHHLPPSHYAKPYTYTIIRSDTANAFVLPGNHVFVMTGLFKYIKDEDELAAVLGHETAHNLARHAGEKVSGVR